MRVTISFFLLLLPTLVFAAPNWTKLLDQDAGSKILWGADLSAPVDYQRNEDEAFAPASNSKLFTTAAILNAVGADYRYPTVLRWNQSADGIASAVTLVGYGDPSWGISELNESPRSRVDQMAKALKDQGVKAVAGEISVVSSDPRWDLLQYPEGWEEEDKTACYGALGQGFNVNLNCATFTVTGLESGKWSMPGLEATPVKFQLDSGRTNSYDMKLADSSQPSLGYVVVGTYHNGTQSFALPVQNVRGWVKGLFLSALQDQAIGFVPDQKNTDAVANKELTFYSPPLSTILKPFLKNSINVIGDSLVKTLGALSPTTMPDKDFLLSGTYQLAQYLSGLTYANELHLVDGAGLSQNSRVSARALLEFLQRTKSLKDFSALWNALPIAGVDGTLKNRMGGTAAEGVLRAKTGTLTGVYNLAGYVPTGTDFIPFVLLTKTTKAYSAAARAGEDRVGANFTAQLTRNGFSSIMGGGTFTSIGADHRVNFGEVPFPYVPEHAGLDAQ